MLWEFLSKPLINDPQQLAEGIKHLPLPLAAARPLAEAISSAGGVAFEAMDEHLMLQEAAGRVLCGRDARLGSANRRLPADRLLRYRQGCRVGGSELVKLGKYLRGNPR